MTPILSDLGEFSVAAGPGDGLWLSREEAATATGWALQPEGLCRGNVCVPVPPGREAEFVADGNINLAAFWDHMDKPTAHSADGDVWALGEGANEQAESLRSLQAPDFTLPDLDGKPRRLSDYKGKKGPAGHLGQLVRLSC